MNRAGVFGLPEALGLVRGPVLGPFDGQRVEVWLREGEPAIAVLVEGYPGDLRGLHRLAWSLGCSHAIARRQDRTVLIEADESPEGPVPARALELGAGDLARRLATASDPAPIPGVVRELVRLAGVWRDRLLRRCLAGHLDWTETGLNLAVETPIAGLLLGAGGGGGTEARMHRELEASGVVIGAVPPGLLALAWDLHLARGVRLAGADAVIGQRPPVDRAGADRLVLRRFAAWAGTDAMDVGSVFVPACGAGRLLLGCGDWAATHSMQLYALDPDPRAVLFATALVEREFGSGLHCTVRAGHPLVEADIDDDPLARMIPGDARARLQPADWSRLFGGVDRFDRVLIGNPAVPLTLRTVVQRYVQGRYGTAGAGTDPALLLVEAGARRLAPGGRMYALYPATAYRAPTASAFRRWLAKRAEALVAAPGYCAVRAAAEPLAAPLLAGPLDGAPPVLRTYPRSALNPGSWTLADPARDALIARLEAGAARLGDVLLGGVRCPAPVALDPGELIGARDRRRLLRADRRAASAIRPVITPEDVVRFGTARRASLFVIAAPLPPRARRAALELGIAPPGTDLLPPPSGPRLLFAEGASAPAFLCDRFGRAVPTPGVGTIAPADPFLAGLLHAAPMAVLIAERCPGGLSARCLARLPVRLPDPYDERERQIGDEIATLAGQRLAIEGRGGADAESHREAVEAAIDRAVERLYGVSSS